MFKIKYTYTLDSKKYLNELSNIFGEKIQDNKFIFHPKEAGEGYAYMLEVTPGVSVLLLDVKHNDDVEVVRYPTEEDLFILHYDLSDEIVLFHVDKTSEISYKANLGFTFMDGSVSSTLRPSEDSSFYALRLIISKDFMYEHMVDGFLSEKKKQYYFHDHIDSESFLLIKSLKEKIIFDDSFEFYLKGVALGLLASFMERYSVKTIQSHNILQSELDSVEHTRRFLLDNLYGSFPGIPFLAEMAGMSESKYKMLFRNIYQITPKKFFIRGKILLAGKLLTTGAFNSISEVVRMLDYTSFSQFSQHYLSVSGYRPSQDFIKKVDKFENVKETLF